MFFAMDSLVDIETYLYRKIFKETEELGSSAIYFWLYYDFMLYTYFINVLDDCSFKLYSKLFFFRKKMS